MAGSFVLLVASLPMAFAGCRLALQQDAVAAPYGAESSACIRLMRSRSGLSTLIGLTLPSTLAAMATLLHAPRHGSAR